MDNFTVAIVGGTGNLGGALALRLGAPGVKIIIGSRVAEKAQMAVETLKPQSARRRDDRDDQPSRGQGRRLRGDRGAL